MDTRARRSLSDMRDRARLAMKFCSLWSSMACLKRFSLLLLHSSFSTPTSGSLCCRDVGCSSLSAEDVDCSNSASTTFPKLHKLGAVLEWSFPNSSIGVDFPI